LHNANGTQAVTVPGRNAAIFTLANDAWSFVPSGPPDATNISWFEGPTPIANTASVTVNPAVTTPYRVEVTYASSPGVFRDSMLVRVDQTVLTTSSTQVSCFGDATGSATVVPSGSGPPPYSFSWSTNPPQTTSTANSLTAGTYYVEVRHGICVFNDSVVVTQPAALLISESITPETCGVINGVTGLQVSGGTGPYQYSWSDGSVNDSLINVQAGSYTVAVTDSKGCTSSKQVSISQVNSVDASFATSVLTGPAPLSVSFTNLSNGAQTYSWDLGNGETSTETSPLVTYTSPGSYLVSLTASFAGTCHDQASVTIVVTDDSLSKKEEVFIPNVISLNSAEPENRLFKVRGSELEQVSMTIFNRWGNVVYTAASKDAGWDGGTESSGTYYYIITYTESGKEPVTEKGFVTLFR
jgi:gliding motility-associated-like protein